MDEQIDSELTGLKIYNDILLQSIPIYSKNRFQLTLVIVKLLCTNLKKKLASLSRKNENLLKLMAIGDTVIWDCSTTLC